VTYEIDVASDVYAGTPHWEDGSARDELVYFVIATAPNGRRFAHFKAFTTEKFTREECEERVARLAAQIGVARNFGWAGPIDNKHWRETYPVYGSKAYENGQAAEVAAERARDEAGY
jgi:hypothetical protein